MGALWQIQLLGALRATCGAWVLDRFRTRRTASLFAYLAFHCRPGHPGFPRSALATQFWPDSSKSAARQCLRQALSDLRRALPSPEGSTGEVLLADGDRTRLNPALCRTDVGGFEAALAASERGGPAVARRALEEALALYQGDLLPGCADDWALPERERLSVAHAAALDCLIALLERDGAWEQALRWAHRAVSADPLREESHRHLIRLLVAAGRVEEARCRYEELTGLLARELGSAPDPATTALLTPAGALPALPRPATVLFGREAEIAFLHDLLGADDAPRLLTLTGAGGCGKTRLALAVAQRLAAEGRSVAFVPLADLSDGRRIPEAIRIALKLPRAAGEEPFDIVSAALARRPVLLLLDNLEHLLDDGVDLIRRLLECAPALTCVVTSRSRLNLTAEREFPVPPLPVPDRPLPLPTSPCVPLFLDRARLARPGFRLNGGGPRACSGDLPAAGGAAAGDRAGGGARADPFAGPDPDGAGAAPRVSARSCGAERRASREPSCRPGVELRPAAAGGAARFCASLRLPGRLRAGRGARRLRCRGGRLPGAAGAAQRGLPPPGGRGGVGGALHLPGAGAGVCGGSSARIRRRAGDAAGALGVFPAPAAGRGAAAGSVLVARLAGASGARIPEHVYRADHGDGAGRGTRGALTGSGARADLGGAASSVGRLGVAAAAGGSTRPLRACARARTCCTGRAGSPFSSGGGGNPAPATRRAWPYGAATAIGPVWRGTCTNWPSSTSPRRETIEAPRRCWRRRWRSGGRWTTTCGPAAC
jgi:DNA-binding SARP family transcriptional activator